MGDEVTEFPASQFAIHYKRMDLICCFQIKEQYKNEENKWNHSAVPAEKHMVHSIQRILPFWRKYRGV